MLVWMVTAPPCVHPLGQHGLLSQAANDRRVRPALFMAIRRRMVEIYPSVAD